MRLRKRKKREEETKIRKKNTKHGPNAHSKCSKLITSYGETINLMKSAVDSSIHSCPGTLKTRNQALEFLQNIYVTGKKLKLVEVKV